MAICCFLCLCCFNFGGLRLLQLCRRRSEEVCWTHWAVATPGAEGVGRLPSRSKWGRYRPKTVFSLVPFECSVAEFTEQFLGVAAVGVLLGHVWFFAL